MKTLPIGLLLAALLSFPARATFTLVQHVAANCGGVAGCNVTVSSTGANHVIVIMGLYGNGSSLTFSASGGGTYTVCSACAAFVGSRGSVGAYTLSSTSGTTTVTGTLSGAPSGGWGADVREYSFTLGVAFDTANVVSNGSNASPPGVALTLSGTNDIIFQSLVSTSTQFANAITSPYNGNPDFDVAGLLSNFADAVNTASGTAPTWTLNAAGTTIGAAIAIMEVSSFSKAKKLLKYGLFSP